jgi:hypothetical protein
MEKVVVRYADGPTWYTYLILAKSIPLVPPWTGCARAVVETLAGERKVQHLHLVWRGGATAALKKAEAHLDSLHPGLRKSRAPLPSPLSNPFVPPEGPATAPESK